MDIGYENVMGACARPFLHKIGDGREFPLPCGRCLSCRIRRRSVWTLRLLQEISSHETASFITLTYNDEVLPVRAGRSILLKSDLQKFFKRLRKHRKGKKIKYYACGEYGEKTDRAHYHAILFNDFPRKEELDEIWGLGITDVGTCTEESIRYVAGYVSKKLGLTEYQNDDRPATFQISSQGIGYEWAKENYIDVLIAGALSVRGKKIPVPRSYVELYKKLYPEESQGFLANRQWEQTISLTERILELVPFAGGKRLEELSKEEKDNFIVQMRKQGKSMNRYLEKKDELKNKEKGL